MPKKLIPDASPPRHDWIEDKADAVAEGASRPNTVQIRSIGMG